MGCQLGKSVSTLAERPLTGKGEMEVCLFEPCSDQAVAHEAKDALQWNVVIPQGRVTVHIADGWLTLKGVLDWQYQKEAAVRAVRHLAGVKGVTNRIILRPDLSGAIRQPSPRPTPFRGSRADSSWETARVCTQAADSPVE